MPSFRSLGLSPPTSRRLALHALSFSLLSASRNSAQPGYNHLVIHLYCLRQCPQVRQQSASCALYPRILGDPADHHQRPGSPLCTSPACETGLGLDGFYDAPQIYWLTYPYGRTAAFPYRSRTDRAGTTIFAVLFSNMDRTNAPGLPHDARRSQILFIQITPFALRSRTHESYRARAYSSTLVRALAPSRLPILSGAFPRYPHVVPAFPPLC